MRQTRRYRRRKKITCNLGLDPWSRWVDIYICKIGRYLKHVYSSLVRVDGRIVREDQTLKGFKGLGGDGRN